MNQIIKIIGIIGILATGPVFGQTTVTGVESVSRTLTLDTKNDGVVKNLFELGLTLYGPGGSGYSSMDRQVKLPKSNLITRLGNSKVPGMTSSGDIVNIYEHYQMNLSFNFVDNDYALVRKGSQEKLMIYGSVADDMMDLSLDQASGVNCVRKQVSVCSIRIK